MTKTVSLNTEENVFMVKEEHFIQPYYTIRAFECPE